MFNSNPENSEIWQSLKHSINLSPNVLVLFFMMIKRILQVKTLGREPGWIDLYPNKYSN